MTDKQQTLRVAVVGASGRMGRAVIRGLAEDAGEYGPSLALGAALGRPGSASVGLDAGILAGTGELGVEVTSIDSLQTIAASTDVLVDFSLPEATYRVLDEVRSAKIPAVICTTGLGARGKEALEKASLVAPVVFATNTSPGVTVLNHLAALATKLLGPGYDAEVVEMHHRHKVDAPSGTAITLGEAVASARHKSLEEVAVYGRHGAAGPRSVDEIGMMTLRGGEVIGEHTLFLAGAAERLELTHRAQDRSLFARGALRAATWVARQRPGLYNMADVMGISRAPLSNGPLSAESER